MPVETPSYTPEQLREIAAQEMGPKDAAQVTTYRTPGGVEVLVPIITPNQPGQKQAGRAYDQSFENLRQAIINRHKATGMRPATVLNFLFMPLVVNSPMSDLKIRIPAAPERLQPGDDEFTQHVFTHAAFEVMQRGDKETRQPWDFYPIMLADAYLQEYRDFGGVVIYEGLPTKEYLDRPEIKEMITNAKQKMVDWMVLNLNDGNAEWNTANHSGHKNIVEKHRRSAMRLLDLRVIDRLPEWVVGAKDLVDVTPACAICKATPHPGAVKCIQCGYIIDPAGAYMNNLINEEDGALERLTRAEVESLGVSAFVAETADEKPLRVKEGRNRPMSIAQERALRADNASQNSGGQQTPARDLY